MTTKKFKNKLSSNNSIVHSKFRMDIEKYLYYGKFTGNILVLGQTGCGKTNFVQNFGKKTICLENLGNNNYVVKRRRTSDKILL